MSGDVIHEAARDTPVLRRCDVLVVGGGSAGVCAAVAAARAGADVVLVERYGSLGGLATGGLIVLLLTLDDGAGRQVIGGLCQEATERMRALGGAQHPPKEEWGSDDPTLVQRDLRRGYLWGGAKAHHRVRYGVGYDPEFMRHVFNQMVLEAKAELLFHMWAADALVEDGRLRGAVFQSKAGRQAILADVVVDATGDGDVFTSAGCAFELEKVHPWLWFRMGGVGDVDEAIRTGGGFETLSPGVVLHPWGSAARIGRRIDATDPVDLSYAEIECRRMVMQEFEKLRGAAPGLRDAHLCNIATQLGITESRRLQGRFVLEREHMNTPLSETVCVTGHWTKYDAVYAIPYGCLVPRETENLLVAGRCISVDHRVHHATKEIPPSMAVGEAAGNAAVLALERGGAVAEVDVSQLQRRIVESGGLLDYFDTGDPEH